MKSITQILLLLTLTHSSCANNKSNESTSETATSSNEAKQGDGIVGDWEQEYTCYDKNNNYKLDAEERTPANNMLGFNWFRFDADGTCLRDKDMQFKGTYKIVEEGGKKRVAIQGSDNLKYSIESLTDKELVLGKSGVFIVFKRIK